MKIFCVKVALDFSNVSCLEFQPIAVQSEYNSINFLLKRLRKATEELTSENKLWNCLDVWLKGKIRWEHSMWDDCMSDRWTRLVYALLARQN